MLFCLILWHQKLAYLYRQYRTSCFTPVMLLSSQTSCTYLQKYNFRKQTKKNMNFMKFIHRCNRFLFSVDWIWEFNSGGILIAIFIKFNIYLIYHRAFWQAILLPIVNILMLICYKHFWIQILTLNIINVSSGNFCTGF
jgi:hypothetical protein